MITFLKVITASWRASVATAVTLSVSATVLGILLGVAFGNGSEGSEGQGVASSFSIITGISAILAARGIQMHSAAAGHVRRFQGIAAPVGLLAAIAVLWTAAGYLVSGVGLAFVGALLSFVVLPWVLGWLLPGLSAFAAARLTPRHAVFHTALRRRASSKAVGVTYGALMLSSRIITRDTTLPPPRSWRHWAPPGRIGESWPSRSQLQRCWCRGRRRRGSSWRHAVGRSTGYSRSWRRPGHYERGGDSRITAVAVVAGGRGGATR